MSLYAISDLHLAFNVDKPMDIFGSKWENHVSRLEENWRRKITEEDTVLIGGDISWGMNMDETIEELDWIHKLPGKKIIIKGNHDYWWNSITKLNSMYDNMKFIQNNSFSYEDYGICGTRGWIIAEEENASEHDKKIYNRELLRLRMSIEDARKKGFTKIIAMIHYPPILEKDNKTKLVEILEEYNVEKVIYGHIHGQGLSRAFKGFIGSCEYILTSGDFIDFDPIKIIE